MSTPQLKAILEAQAQVARFEEHASVWAAAARDGHHAARGDSGRQLYYRWMVKFRNLAAWWRTELRRRELGQSVAGHEHVRKLQRFD